MGADRDHHVILWSGGSCSSMVDLSTFLLSLTPQERTGSELICQSNLEMPYLDPRLGQPLTITPPATLMIDGWD